MGVVWQARDERLGRLVALKQLVLPPGLSEAQAERARARAEREGRIAARFQHPNAVTVFTTVTHQGTPCLVMEFVPAPSLDSILRERDVLPPTEAAGICAQVASALAAAHAAGIVHRDIKPANILLADSGTAKITDFGVSRADGDVVITQDGLGGGTPAFLAPEIAKGKEATQASDVFSLGATLYDAIEGQPPFGVSDNPLALLRMVAVGRIQPPERAGEVTGLLMAMLSPDPGQRPTMAQAATSLAAAAQGRPTVIEPTYDTVGIGKTVPLTRRAARMANRRRQAPHRALVIGAAVVLPILALVGVTIAVAGFGGQSEQTNPGGMVVVTSVSTVTQRVADSSVASSAKSSGQPSSSHGDPARTTTAMPLPPIPNDPSGGLFPGGWGNSNLFPGGYGWPATGSNPGTSGQQGTSQSTRPTSTQNSTCTHSGHCHG